jgi:hypothetical protein
MISADEPFKQFTVKKLAGPCTSTMHTLCFHNEITEATIRTAQADEAE